jgi:hypothetical protein
MRWRKKVMRMCSLAANAAEAPTKVMNTSRKTENSSVKAKDTLVA